MTYSSDSLHFDAVNCFQYILYHQNIDYMHQLLIDCVIDIAFRIDIQYKVEVMTVAVKDTPNNMVSVLKDCIYVQSKIK